MKIHKKVGVQCKIIYNSEAPYSTGLQNWKSWRKKSANLMQWILGSSEKLLIKERIQQLVLVKKTRPITFPLKKILICKYCQHESMSRAVWGRVGRILEVFFDISFWGMIDSCLVLYPAWLSWNEQKTFCDNFLQVFPSLIPLRSSIKQPNLKVKQRYHLPLAECI